MNSDYAKQKVHSFCTSSGDTSGGSESSVDTSGSSGSGSSGSGDTSSGESSTGEPCVPTEEICNDLDDDCDNIVDDVDVGMDGICDCLSIALVGNQGSNPSAEFQMWPQDQGTTVQLINSNVMNDVNTPLTPAVLAKYDIVILDYLQRSYSAQEASDVRVWIEGGAGLMSMTGHVGNQAAADRPNSILSTMGLTYNTSAGFFSGPIAQFVMHPITEGLTSITFLGGLFVDIVDDGVGMNQVFMTLPPGPVGVVQDRVDGRVFVFGDEWVEFDSMRSSPRALWEAGMFDDIEDEEPTVRVMALPALVYCQRLFYLEEVEEIRSADAAVFAGRTLHEELD